VLSSKFQFFGNEPGYSLSWRRPATCAVSNFRCILPSNSILPELNFTKNLQRIEPQKLQKENKRIDFGNNKGSFVSYLAGAGL